jgi:hypothetical protein
MACKGTLVVEHDANNKLVRWELRCEGKCQEAGKECARRTLDVGGTMYYCACNEDREDDDVPRCRFQVYVSHLREGGSTRAACVGRCSKLERCRPLVVKEYKVIQTNQEHQIELDELKVHTVRHIVCGCASEIV